MRSDADTPASLFIYFKLARAQAATALQALQSMQAGLVAAHPGLRARLLARTDQPGSEDLTWMEIYELPLGPSPTFLADLDAASLALPAGLIGPRHTETFSEFRLPAGNAA